MADRHEIVPLTEQQIAEAGANEARANTVEAQREAWVLARQNNDLHRERDLARAEADRLRHLLRRVLLSQALPWGGQAECYTVNDVIRPDLRAECKPLPYDAPVVLSPASPAAPPKCAECGKPVEEARRCYAVPTCYACLPPPEPLPVVKPPSSAAPSSEYRRGYERAVTDATEVVRPWLRGVRYEDGHDALEAVERRLRSLLPAPREVTEELTDADVRERDALLDKLAACEAERDKAREAAQIIGRTLQHQVLLAKTEYERAKAERSQATARAEADRLREAVEVREALIAKLREPSEAHRRYVSLMDGTPDGTRPMNVYYTPTGEVVVNGDPSDEPDDADESRHNCDAMGCTSGSHVLWRGTLADFWAMCEQRSAPSTPASTPPCSTCGKPVEEARGCYAIMTCYDCLPPPDPLPVAKSPPSAATSSEFQRGYEKAVEDAIKEVDVTPYVGACDTNARFHAAVVAALRSLLPAPEREGTEEAACCVCGRLASACAKGIVDPNAYPDDGEWFCSPECNEAYHEVEGDYEKARAVLAAQGERGGK